MKMLRSNKLIIAIFVLLVTMSGSVMAQTATTPDNTATSTRHDDDRNNYSWIGLLGLAGLLGLMGKRKYDASAPRTATR